MAGKPTRRNMYILIIHPDSYDCNMKRFEKLKDALEAYEEYHSYGSDPILTQQLEIELVIRAKVKEDGENT